MKKHYRILIEVKDVTRLLDKNDIKETAEKYLNLDDEPKITLREGRIDYINFRVNHDNPIKNYESNDICSAVSIIVKLIRLLGIIWKTIEIYETTTYEEEGSIIAGVTAGAGASKKDLLPAIGSAVLGGLAGYLLGGRLEKVDRLVCEFENRYDFPILVYKGA
jgi:hypothetical protein